MKGRSKY